ncbi:orphan G-protein coupled receptor 58 [Elysia marginata]|uniref:Orphan G-protein coupled receptor 58 n=1 Tax=Elysia marginata TaxID=1093978 RepID=A0AAV4IJP5_9GAST|nr:orphan G-protein coupled receptor 58 [Elysia marginata]
MCSLSQGLNVGLPNSGLKSPELFIRKPSVYRLCGLANSVSNQDEVLLMRRRLALMMIIISILFAACWLPYYICNICLDFEVDTATHLIDLYPFAILLGHSNSAQVGTLAHHVVLQITVFI